MDLLPAKKEILEALLLQSQPTKAALLARDMGKEFPAVQMHLIGLTKMGYADSPQKGQYNISENGKKALGIPETTIEKAKQILAQTTQDKSFHFYAGIGKPLNIYAHSLFEFRDKVNQVNIDSIEFHLNRGDFEAWFQSIGDTELAKTMSLLKAKKMKTYELSKKILELAQNRCTVLSKKVGQ